MTDFHDVTNDESVAIYEASVEIFAGLIREIRELSKKKPDAIMSAGKVKLINRVLTDLKSVLQAEPEGKYLDILSDEDLPQFSDAVLVMVQYETTLLKFSKRYKKKIEIDWDRNKVRWITPEIIALHEEFLKIKASEYGDS